MHKTNQNIQCHKEKTQENQGWYKLMPLMVFLSDKEVNPIKKHINHNTNTIIIQ